VIVADAVVAAPIHKLAVLVVALLVFVVAVAIQVSRYRLICGPPCLERIFQQAL
jgi:hypothetical protein